MPTRAPSWQSPWAWVSSAGRPRQSAEPARQPRKASSAAPADRFWPGLPTLAPSTVTAGRATRRPSRIASDGLTDVLRRELAQGRRVRAWRAHLQRRGRGRLHRRLHRRRQQAARWRRQLHAHLRERRPPSVNKFWSVTMYGPDYNLVPNPLNRFAIRDRTPNVKQGADGSTTFYLQATSPGPEREANWLPTPDRAVRHVVARLRAKTANP
ncbi:DUF1214 domain-containing protein [Bosea sp. UC22_33]|uniref:DUF1214 domain-containing protein n=1 Tax=Bosea sp. UC22_33 TaxID=3350165 RepID=UPI00367151FE